MRRAILAILFLLWPQISDQPVIIPVPSLTEWRYGAGSRIAQLPDGAVVAVAGYGSSLAVDLGVTPKFGVYVLKVPLANYFYSYPGPYEITLFIGTKEFCSTYGWGVGPFTEITLTCPVSNYFTLYNGFGFDASQHLMISFHGTGWPVYFKDVSSLTFTPEIQ